MKLYDWRFATQLRKNQRIDPWTWDAEVEYIMFVLAGGVKEGLRWPEYDNYAYDDDDGNIDHVVDDDDESSDDDDDDPGQNEAPLAMDCCRMYQSETSVYARLIHHQGHIMPRLLVPVVLGPSTPREGGRQYQKHFEVRGILLECLSGVTMSQNLTQSVPQSAPPSGFQNMVDQALHITHVLGDNNVLNADVRAANFIVSDGRGSSSATGEGKVFMIDFGQSRLRREDEDDQERGRAKWVQDEEDAVGHVLQHKLRQLGVEISYQKSLRYYEFANTDPGFEDGEERGRD